MTSEPTCYKRQCRWNVGVMRPDRKEVEEVIRSAIAGDPDYAIAHYDLGWILARTAGRHKAALASFKRALALDKDLPWAYYSIACIYALWGQKKPALAFFEKALQKGLDDRAHIEGDSDLDALRNDTRFLALMERDGKYGIDTGAVYGGPLTCTVLREMSVYQT